MGGGGGHPGIKIMACEYNQLGVTVWAWLEITCMVINR